MTTHNAEEGKMGKMTTTKTEMMTILVIASDTVAKAIPQEVAKQTDATVTQEQATELRRAFTEGEITLWHDDDDVAVSGFLTSGTLGEDIVVVVSGKPLTTWFVRK